LSAQIIVSIIRALALLTMACVSVALQGSLASMAVESSLATVAAKGKIQSQDMYMSCMSTTDELPSMSADDSIADSSSDVTDDVSEPSSDEHSQEALTNGITHHEASEQTSSASQMLAAAEWLVVNRLSACCSSHELLSSTCALVDSSSEIADNVSELSSGEGVTHHQASKLDSFASQMIAAAEWLIVNRLSACCSSHELLSSTCALADSSSDIADNVSELSSGEGVTHHQASKLNSFASQMLAAAEWLIVNRLSACCGNHELLSSTCA
jgi:hypothetical protein